MAHLALLLGSDYTEGVTGVGIVNALEVVTAFPGIEGLREFKAWADRAEFSRRRPAAAARRPRSPRHRDGPGRRRRRGGGGGGENAPRTTTRSSRMKLVPGRLATRFATRFSNSTAR